MKDRIQAFLQSENKSYAQFAEEIGVQPSGISHILSGRNNPSLDFVIKMLHRYPSLSHEWLLFGRGPMYRQVSQPTLFEDEPSEDLGVRSGPIEIEEGDSDPGIDSGLHESRREAAGVFHAGAGEPGAGPRKLTRIVMFFSDKTFTEYTSS